MSRRRQYLRALGVATVTLLAGCSTGDETPTTETDASATGTPNGTDGTDDERDGAGEYGGGAGSTYVFE